MSEFNQEDRFTEIWKSWPVRDTKDEYRRNEKQAARAVFMEKVGTNDDLNKVKVAIIRAIRASRSGIPQEQLSAIIVVALDTEKLLAQVVERPVPEVKAPAASSSPLEPPSAKDDTFDEIWSQWPVNEEHPETEGKARAGWEEASMRHPEENLVLACTHYITSFMNPSKGMKYPKHLSNFVRDDDAVETALLALANIVPSGDIVEFEVVWNLYPKFPEKSDPDVKKASLTFWRRHIKRQQRPDFLCAVAAYRTKRRDRLEKVMPGEVEDAQTYTKGLVSFIASWRTQPGLAKALGDFLAKPLLLAFQAAGGGFSWGEWIKGAIMYVAKTKPEAKLVDIASAVLERMAEGDGITIDIPTLAAKAVNDGYVLACKPRESMASSPGATSP